MTDRDTTAQAVAALNELTESMTSDPEVAHSRADSILLGLVPSDVASAYRRLVARCGWWASA